MLSIIVLARLAVHTLRYTRLSDDISTLTFPGYDEEEMSEISLTMYDQYLVNVKIRLRVVEPYIKIYVPS